jgi:D-arabinose 5-phosphate isomerase GutQ
VVAASSVVVEELLGRDALVGEELANTLAALGGVGIAAHHVHSIAAVHRVKRSLNATD